MLPKFQTWAETLQKWSNFDHQIWFLMLKTLTLLQKVMLERWFWLQTLSCKMINLRCLKVPNWRNLSFGIWKFGLFRTNIRLLWSNLVLHAWNSDFAPESRVRTSILTSKFESKVWKGSPFEVSNRWNRRFGAWKAEMSRWKLLQDRYQKGDFMRVGPQDRRVGGQNSQVGSKIDHFCNHWSKVQNPSFWGSKSIISAFRGSKSIIR